MDSLVEKVFNLKKDFILNETEKEYGKEMGIAASKGIPIGARSGIIYTIYLANAKKTWSAFEESIHEIEKETGTSIIVSNESKLRQLAEKVINDIGTWFDTQIHSKYTQLGLNSIQINRHNSKAFREYANNSLSILFEKTKLKMKYSSSDIVRNNNHGKNVSDTKIRNAMKLLSWENPWFKYFIIPIAVIVIGGIVLYFTVNNKTSPNMGNEMTSKIIVQNPANVKSTNENYQNINVAGDFIKAENVVRNEKTKSYPKTEDSKDKLGENNIKIPIMTRVSKLRLKDIKREMKDGKYAKTTLVFCCPPNDIGKIIVNVEVSNDITIKEMKISLDKAFNIWSPDYATANYKTLEFELLADITEFEIILITDTDPGQSLKVDYKTAKAIQ